MAAIRGRPVLMQRFPNGVDGSSFFQKRVPKDAPDWLETSVVSTPNGTTSQALVAADLAHIVWAVNLGCLGFHVWPNLARRRRPRRRAAHRPRPAARRRLRRGPRDAARELKGLLDELGIRGWPKTTGNRGIHVYTRPRAAVDTDRGPARSGRGRARAGTPSTRRDHRRVVEGGAGRAHLRRLQPERAAQDGVRRVVGAGAPGRRRCRRRSTGTSSTTSIPRRAPLATVPGRVASAGRPVGRHRRRPAGADAAARDVRPRHRTRGSRTRRGRPSTRRCRANRRRGRAPSRAKKPKPEVAHRLGPSTRRAPSRTRRRTPRVARDRARRASSSPGSRGSSPSPGSTNSRVGDLVVAQARQRPGSSPHARGW